MSNMYKFKPRPHDHTVEEMVICLVELLKAIDISVSQEIYDTLTPLAQRLFKEVSNE